MIRTKDEIPIHYYELDYPKVDLFNYKESALKAEFDLNVVNFIESFLCYSESEIFDYYPDDPEDVKKLEYYSNLWIEKDFYLKIANIIFEYKIPHKPGTICLVLLILKKYDKWLKHTLKLKKNIHDLNPDQHRIYELGRFLNTILDEVPHGLNVESIELNVNRKKIKYNHGDYILKHIAKCFRFYYHQKGNKLIEAITFPNPEFKLFKNDIEEQFNFRKLEEKLREFSISVIYYLISLANTKEYKSFIINQLLGVNNILNYHYHKHYNKRMPDDIKPKIIENISKLATKYKSNPIECLKELWA